MNGALDPAAALAALLGAGTGFGLVVAGAGARGIDPDGPGHRLPARARRAPGAPLDHRLVLRFGLMVAAGLLTAAATGWFVGAVLAALAAWAMPQVLGPDREHARRVARIEAIATWTESLRDTLSAAAGLEQAILATAPLAPQAISEEITDLAARIENGDRLAPALRRLGDDLADPTGDLVIAALVLAAEQQARQLADLLGSLAHAAREQASMRMRVEAGRARTRTSMRVIVGTTLVFAFGLVLLNGSYLSAYDSAEGQVVLLGVGALFTLGFAWMARIARVTEPGRVLSAPASDPLPATRFAADSRADL